MPNPFPKVDPSLFEWEPKDIPDEDAFETMAELGALPEEIPDLEERAAYTKFLEKFNAK